MLLPIGPAEYSRLLRYLDASNHVEHILPQTPSDEVAAEFGEGCRTTRN